MSEPPPEGGTLNAVARTPLPAGRFSALQEDEERFYALLILEQSAERVKAAMVEWRKTPFDEWWSGVRGQMEMAAPAGGEYRSAEIAKQGQVDSETARPKARLGRS